MADPQYHILFNPVEWYKKRNTQRHTTLPLISAFIHAFCTQNSKISKSAICDIKVVHQ
jgi:hypothetical protein